MLRQMRSQTIMHSCDEHTIIDTLVDGILKQGKIVQGPGQEAAVELYLKASLNMADKEEGQGSKAKYEDWNLSDMIEHMKKDCPKKQKFCPLCRKEFQDYAQTREHLRIHCHLVEIVCETCDKTLKRQDFAKHICFLKLANFKEVIEVKDEVRMDALQQNEKLLQQITDASNQMQVEEAEQQKEIHDLKIKIDDMDAHTDRQTKMVQTARELQNLQRSRFLEGMI